MATHRAVSEHMLLSAPSSPSSSSLFIPLPRWLLPLSSLSLYTTPLLLHLFLIPPSLLFSSTNPPTPPPPPPPRILSSLASSQSELTTEKTLTGSHSGRGSAFAAFLDILNTGLRILRPCGDRCDTNQMALCIQTSPQQLMSMFSWFELNISRKHKAGLHRI